MKTKKERSSVFFEQVKKVLETVEKVLSVVSEPIDRNISISQETIKMKQIKQTF